MNAASAAGLQVGIALPFFDHQMSYDRIAPLTARIEELGFDGVWLSDHITGPTPAGSRTWYDAPTLLSALAARTSRLTLGLDVLIPAYRHPLVAAKQLTTVAAVSGGRLVVGIGGGYVEREFRDLGLPYADRGAYTDECLAIWKRSWGPGNVTFAGRFFQIDDAIALPKPDPAPVLLVGGSGARVQRRVIEYGDGWHPIALPYDAYASGVDALRDAWSAAGRDGEPLLSYSGIFGEVGPDPVPEQSRPMLVGGIGQVVADLERLRALGVGSVVFRPGGPDTPMPAVTEQLELLARDVLPATR